MGGKEGTGRTVPFKLSGEVVKLGPGDLFQVRGKKINHSVKEAGHSEWRNCFKEFSLMKGKRLQNCYCCYDNNICVFYILIFTKIFVLLPMKKFKWILILNEVWEL